MANTLQYKEEYCELLILHMAKGYSISTFGATIGVTRTSLYDWFAKYPAFDEAKDIAVQKAQSFMEKRLMAKISGQDLTSLGINTKNIDTTALIFALKTRFHKDYGEKQKHEVSGKIDINQINLDVDDSEL